MSLASLKVSGLRCLTEAALDFGPHLNLIHGPNGSGKTSILESVFLVGRGRSFRTRHTEQLIARGGANLQLFAQTIQPAHRIGFEYRRDESYTARLDGEDVRSLAQLPGAAVLAPGYGASDCRQGCRAHLVRLPDDLALDRLEGMLCQKPT